MSKYDNEESYCQEEEKDDYGKFNCWCRKQEKPRCPEKKEEKEEEENCRKVCTCKKICCKKVCYEKPCEWDGK